MKDSDKKQFINLNSKANKARKKSDYELAIKYYKKALKIQPQSVTTLLELSFCSIMQSKYKDSKMYLTSVIEIAPKYDYPRLLLGMTFFLLMEYKEAKKQLNIYLRSNPKDEFAHSILCECLFETEDYDKLLNNLAKTKIDSNEIDEQYALFKLTKQAIEYNKNYKKCAEIEYVSSLCEYIEVINKIKNKSGNENATFIYRGQDNRFFTLTSSLYRKDGYKEREENIIKDFNLKADGYFKHEMAHFEKVDKLALMQHHGIPTKLLDFTESPILALYFALKDLTREFFDKAPCVYVIDISAFKKNKGRILSSSQVEDKSGTKIFSSSYQNANFAFSPKLKSERLTAQKGVFIAMKDDEPLESSAKGYLIKIIIPRAFILSIRQELHNMGITPTTIYPDFEGLAKEVQDPRKFAEPERDELVNKSTTISTLFDKNL